MDLGAKTAPGTTQCMVIGFPENFFFLPGSGGRAMRTRGRGINVPLVPIQQTLLVDLQLQDGQYLGKSAVVPPSAKAPVHRLPGAIALRNITPCSPAEEHPEDAVEDLAVRPPWATLHGFLLREQPCYPLPLLVAEFISSHPQVCSGKTSCFPPKMKGRVLMRHNLSPPFSTKPLCQPYSFRLCFAARFASKSKSLNRSRSALIAR